MNSFKISEPSTVNFSTGNNLQVFFSNGLPYHVEATSNQNKNVKFPVPGVYYSPNRINSINPGIKYPKIIKMPEQDRYFNKFNFHIVEVPELKNTPARIFYETGRCEVSPSFLKMPFQFQKFIIEHEKGHFYYSDELNADIYALNSFMQQGFNYSQAYFALENLLTKNQLNLQRIKTIYNTIGGKQNEY
jgi:hypothetical protein